MKKRLILAATAAAAVLGSGAQINSPSGAGYVERAVTMYDDGNYNGCIDQLGYAATLKLDAPQAERADFYRALATEHIDRMLAATLFEDFLQRHMSSALRNRVMFELGNCWFGTDYARALDYYDDVYDTALDDREYEDLCYRMAYCCLQQGQLDDAFGLFESLQYSKRYASAATFYKGYIAYTKGNYPQALQYFTEADTSTPPGDMADFYLAQIYFNKGDFGKAYTLATGVLKNPRLSEEFTPEIVRIAGESAYQLGDDAQAGRYLAYYVSLVETPVPSALYILGLYAYNSGEYPLAVKYMQPASECDDAMGQSACLYLGQADIKLADYDGAVLAFEKAMHMDYDPAVKETAYYNYAVAAMEGGIVPFGSSVNTFSQFLRLFPDSRYAPAVQDYIITSYITDNNYQAALESINAMKQPSEATLAAKQRVLYVLGTKVLAASDNKIALDYLAQADALAACNADIAREVSLSYGEALYRSGSYAEAAKAVNRYLAKAPATAENRPLAYYDLGYALFAQKDYGRAAEAFSSMLASPGKLSAPVKADAYNRLGDCLFAAKDFSKAADAYAKAFKEYPASGDYALYQEALMSGYLKQHTNKIKLLDNMLELFPDSDLAPSAMLQKCESFIQLGENSSAVAQYRHLVAEYPGTSQARTAYLQMALTLLDSGNPAEAKKAYREVISLYPSSEEALTAIDQMKKLCADDGTLPEFTAFVNGVAGAPGIDVAEVDLLTFETAEKAYIGDDDPSRLKAYIDAYPEGRYRAKALSYLIEDEYYSGNLDAAYAYASALVAQYPDNSLVANAYMVMAQTEESQGRDVVALESWRKLAQTATTPELGALARSGIMRTGLASLEYDAVIAAADRSLSASAPGTDEYIEAAYHKGAALMGKGAAADARSVWDTVATSTDNAYGIQSAYRIAKSYYDEGDYENASRYAELVTKANSPHHYWTARAFILYSDILSARGETYKARQYLESLKKNYPGTEADIFEMINSRL